jgi:hypothetical protein
MWIVRLALDRPYTFVVVAILICVLGFTAISTTPTDVFPNIDIPVVTVICRQLATSSIALVSHAQHHFCGEHAAREVVSPRGEQVKHSLSLTNMA